MTGHEYQISKEATNYLDNYKIRGILEIAHIFIILVVPFLLFILFVPASYAAIYYVDQHHPSASDANHGTEDLPWKTIGHAGDVAQAGDTIYVKKATYNERVDLANSGNRGTKITLKSSPRRAATVVGGFDVDGDHIRVEGFTIIAGESAIGVKIRGDYVDIVDNYFYNNRYKAIRGDLANNPKSAYIAGNHIYHSQSGIVVEGEAWLVENNEIERLYDYGGGDCDYARFFGDNHVFRHNYFHGTTASEIGGAHVDCFQTWGGGGKHAHNILFENNRCYHFHQVLMTENYYDDISHLIFKNNVFAHGTLGGKGYGLFVKGVPHIVATNNTFVNIRYTGVLIRNDNSRPKYAIIKNNIFYSCNNAYSLDDTSSTADYNLFFNTGYPSSHGAHDLENINPLFVRPENNDYSLQTGSPACEAGEGGTYIGAIPCVASTSDTEAPSIPIGLEIRSFSSSQTNLF